MDQGIRLLINMLIGKLVEDISSIRDYFKNHPKISKFLWKLPQNFGSFWTNITWIFKLWQAINRIENRDMGNYTRWIISLNITKDFNSFL